MAILLFAGSINAFLVYQTALVFKLSEERDLFSSFTKTNKNNVPYMSMIFLVVVAIIYVLTNNLFNIIAYFALAVSCLKITMVTSATYLRIKDKDYKKIWKDGWYYTFLTLAYITCALTFVGAILALFMFNPKDQAVSQLIFQIIFLVVLLALMPVGYIKYYFQDMIDKKLEIRKQLKLETNKELKEKYKDDKSTYLAKKQEYSQKINEEYNKYKQSLKK